MQNFTSLPRFANRQIAGYVNNPLLGIAPSYGGMLRLSPQDNLLATKGGLSMRMLDVYLDLLTDAHTFTMWDKQINEICSRPVSIIPGGKAPDDIAAAQFAEDYLSKLGITDASSHNGHLVANNDANLDKTFYGLGLALIAGYSVAEIIWSRDELGRVIPNELHMLDPRRILFYANSEGKIYPKLLTRKHSYEGIFIPDRKFILHQHWAMPSEDPHGFGLGRHLYYPVQWKREVLTYWLGIIDRHHEPTVIGAYPGTASAEQIAEFFTIINNITNQSSIVMPEGFSVSFADHNIGNAEQLLKSLIDYCDRQISLVLLGEVTTGEETPGNNAGEDISNNIRLSKAKAWSDAICATLNSTLLRWTTELNFPGAKSPKLTRSFTKEESTDALIDRIAKLVGAGYKPEPDWVSKKTGIPFVKPKQLKPIPS